jgi:hypothetical protein
VRATMFNPSPPPNLPAKEPELGLSTTHDIAVKQHGGLIETSYGPSHPLM